MLNKEIMELLVPKMTIEYRIEKGFLTLGNFEEIPKNAFGAYIGTRFPVVNANGQFAFSGESFNLFVGEGSSIDEILKQASTSTTTISTETIEKIKEYKEKGFTRFATTQMGVVPLRPPDAVFGTNEEMAQAIKKIYRTFKSVEFLIQNSSVEMNKSGISK